MRHNEKMVEKRKLKRTYAATHSRYGSGVWYDDRKQRYVRIYIGSPGYGKFLRRISNKRLRKDKRLYQGSAYKRIYDYWWELY